MEQTVYPSANLALRDLIYGGDYDEILYAILNCHEDVCRIIAEHTRGIREDEGKFIVFDIPEED